MRSNKYFLILALLLALVVLAACGGADVSDNEPVGAADDQTGANDETGATEEPTTADVTPGITLQEISDAQKSVQSYHYKQTVTVSANEESYTIEIYYKDNKMKIVTNIADIGDSYAYYDLVKGEMINYTPSQGAEALRMSIDANSEEIPANPLEIDYINDYQLTGTESIDGYDCQILTSLDGSLKVWIMQEYGFPIRMEMTEGDFGTTYITEFEDFFF